jgi:aspartate-semialdehyde dehydrogenase
VTILAVLHPTTLLGKELRRGLERRADLWTELRLLSTDEEEVGTLADVRGGAALVTRYDEESLDGVDLAFFCGPIAVNRPLLAELPSDTTAIVLSTDATRGDGVPVVAGVNLEPPLAGRVLVSPHPGAIALAHLLHPLRGLELEEVVATLVQPASLREEAALHELFEQTRSILTFTKQPKPAIFGRQLAFNLLPVPGPSDHLVGHLRALLGEELEASLQVLQGGVFHGVAVSIYFRLGSDPGVERVRAALAAHPEIELFEEPDLLGPVDAAQSDSLLVGHVRADARRAGAYWAWAAMDNLTRGGALNALLVAEAVVG